MKKECVCMHKDMHAALRTVCIYAVQGFRSFFLKSVNEYFGVLYA